jgi:MOSC domain-containing protein YiiM
MNTPILRSIQTGNVRTYDAPEAGPAADGNWTTGFFKEAVTGLIRLSTLGLDGDQHHFYKHGGPDKALLAYSAQHYPRWEAELGLSSMPYGGFGENFTIDGLAETSVCIGDRYAVGLVEVEVTQPRQPCSNLVRRWNRRDMAKLVQNTRRPGWYLRVLKEGYVESGLPVVLLDRPYPQWTIGRAIDIMSARSRDREAALQLGACPALSSGWREQLQSISVP